MPAIETEPGDCVVLHSRDASDGQISRHSGVQDLMNVDFTRVNPVSGPIFVKGAHPGDTLAVEVLELRGGDWGWTAIVPGFGLLADEYPDPWLRISQIDPRTSTVRFSEQVSLPLRPFPGTIGVAPAGPGPYSTLAPTRWGGNLDTKHLTAGSTLYLPVAVEGALLSLGDTHAAQGDGEVCGSAVEAAMDVTVRISIRRDLTIAAPQIDLPAATAPRVGSRHVCTGVGPDLMEAARDATRAMIDYLGQRHGVDREEAYALASVACDLRIHEVVDAPNWTVGSLLPESIFGETGPDPAADPDPRPSR